jgi:hypothetical protein
MTVRRNALAAREAIEASHPEIRITTPLVSASHQWELSIGGETSQYGDFWLMVDHIAAVFGMVIEA